MTVRKVMVCAAVAVAGLGGVREAHADDAGNNIFSFSGFGTVGVAHSNYSGADFKTEDTVPRGSGASHSWSATQMSRLGAQIDAQFSSRLSASIQAVSEYDYDGNYAPQITIASAKFQLTPNMAVQGGRFVLPMYMLTEYSRVGYALPWARPPLEMYRSYPSIDGIELANKFNLGSTALTTQVYAGRSKHNATVAPDATTEKIDFDPVWGVTATADQGASTFRVAYVNARTTISGSTLNNVASQYQQAGYGSLLNQYQANGRFGTYTALGYAYDPGDWFFRSEYAKVRGNNTTVLPVFTDWYVTAGYRIEQFTPYVIYGRDKNNGTTSIGAADPLGYINNALLAGDGSRHSISLGLRWDFHENMDMKLQFTRSTRDTSTSNNGLSDVAPGASLPSSYNVVFAGYDFVF
jgi:hypothetical protein